MNDERMSNISHDNKMASRDEAIDKEEEKVNIEDVNLELI